METRRKQKIRKRSSRPPKERRRVQLLTAVVAIALGLLLAWQAIRDIVEGNPVMRENYLGQPVGPGLQLVVVAAVVLVGGIALWQHFRPSKPESRRKGRRNKPCDPKYPHERIP
jgi:hypothetical protein